MAPLAEITRRTESTVPVSSVTGEIDLSNVDTVENQALRDVAPDGPFILDMSTVTFLDSVGIAMLDRIVRQIPQTHLVVTDGGPVARLLDIVGLTLPRHPTVADAIRFLTAG